MAAPLFLRALPLHRHLLHPILRNICGSLTLRYLGNSSGSTRADSSSLYFRKFLSSTSETTKDLTQSSRENEPDYRKWKVKESEILNDIESIVCITKEILHSDRYMDGERLTHDDQEVVVDKLLAYHPHAEDKIGCGLDSIMVDRHPHFKQSRCLFVVRTDGGWIDFSYQKCLRAYIRDKYSPHAERFIREHFKRTT